MTDIEKLAAMPCEGEGGCPTGYHFHHHSTCWPCHARNDLKFPSGKYQTHYAVAEVARLRAKVEKYQKALEFIRDRIDQYPGEIAREALNGK